MHTLRPAHLTAAAFSPFGEVIAAGSHPCAINQGWTERHHDLAPVDASAEGGRAILSVFRSTPLPRPLTLTLMERHPLSSQAFVPLSGRAWLVVVAPPGPFDPAGLRAFLAGPHQGVSYRRGTWHHFLLALGEVSDFLVVDRDGPGDNCDEVVLDPPVRVDLESP